MRSCSLAVALTVSLIGATTPAPATTPECVNTDFIRSGRGNVSVTETHDKDTPDGQSLRLTHEKLNPEKGDTACASDAYGYPPYPGRYRFTWRLKIDANTGDTTVASIVWEVYVVTNRGLAIKSSDFRQPNTYQEFTVEGVVPENVYGVYMTSFYSAARRTLWWDRVTYELVEPYDDARVIQLFYPDFKLPAQLKRTASRETLRALVTCGNYIEASGVREALQILGLRAPTNSPLPADMRLSKVPPTRQPGQWREIVFIDNGQVRDRTPGFPDTADGTAELDASIKESLDAPPQDGTESSADLLPSSAGHHPKDTFADLDLIILANVPARALRATSRVLLREWVRTAGGGLLLTGGWTALGKGRFEGTALEDIMPVELTSRTNDTRMARDGRLVFRDGAPAPATEEPLATRYYQVVKVKPGARVLIETAEGAPLLVDWPCGAGRVAVWAGLPIGLAPAGQSTWWKSDQWPAIMTDIIKRTAGKQILD